MRFCHLTLPDIMKKKKLISFWGGETACFENTLAMAQGALVGTLFTKQLMFSGIKCVPKQNLSKNGSQNTSLDKWK